MEAGLNFLFVPVHTTQVQTANFMQLINSGAAAACERNSFHRSTMQAHHMPGEVLEHLLAHLPFRGEVRAIR